MNVKSLFSYFQVVLKMYSVSMNSISRARDPSFVLASKYFLNKTFIGNTYFTICRQHTAEKRFL